MKKRILAIILLLTMAAACFTSCGDSSSTPFKEKEKDKSKKSTTQTTTMQTTTLPETKTASETQPEPETTTQSPEENPSDLESIIKSRGTIEYDKARTYKKTDGEWKYEVSGKYQTDELYIKNHEQFVNICDDGRAYMLLWDGSTYTSTPYRYLLAVTEDGKNWHTVDDPEFISNVENGTETSTMLGEYYAYQYYVSAGLRGAGDKGTKAFKLDGGKMLVFSSFTEEHTSQSRGSWAAVVPDENNITVTSYDNLYNADKEWYVGFKLNDGTVCTGKESVVFDLTPTDKKDANGNEIFELKIADEIEKKELYSGEITIDPKTLKPIAVK